MSKNFQNQNEFNKLLHDVFVKNPRGAELLAGWTESISITPGHAEGKDLYDLGRVEGQKEFVRKILFATKQAEGKQ